MRCHAYIGARIAWLLMGDAALRVDTNEVSSTTESAEGVSPLLPPPPPLDPKFDVSDTSSSIAEAAAAACDREPKTEGETTMVEKSPDVEAAALAAVDGHFDVVNVPAPLPLRAPTEDNLDVPTEPAPRPLRVPTEDNLDVPIETLGTAADARVESSDTPTVESPAIIVDKAPAIVDDRATIESPKLTATLAEVTAHDDTVAAQRGVRPLTSPYARSTSSGTSTRKVLIASVSVAVVSLGIAIGSVMWARDAVANAGHVEPAPISKIVEPRPAPAPVEPPAAVVIEPPAAVQTCSLDVSTTVAGAVIFIDGMKSAANAPVECDKPVTVEVRHARYETFRRTITPTGHEELRATLEREKTSLTVVSDPAGATVTYNGKPIGKTPLKVKIARYERGTLDFSMPGMQSDWRRIVPKTAEKTVVIQLRKQ